jgi:hypothetical protein
MPKAELVCTDDDPACDAGASTGDTACTFRVALCLNVSERRFVDRAAQPLCRPTDVASVSFTSPKEAEPRDSLDAEIRDALEAAFAGLGGTVRQQCQRRTVEPSTPCATDDDCGASGRCRARFILFAPPLDDRDRCTAFANVVVHLRHGARGALSRSRTLRVTTSSSDGAIRDADVLKLVCRPAAP